MCTGTTVGRFGRFGGGGGVGFVRAGLGFDVFLRLGFDFRLGDMSTVSQGGGGRLVILRVAVAIDGVADALGVVRLDHLDAQQDHHVSGADEVDRVGRDAKDRMLLDLPALHEMVQLRR